MGNKAREQNTQIQTFYIDVSSILFTYNENDLFPLRGGKADRRGEEKERNCVSGRREKKFRKCPWTIHRREG